MTSPFYNYAQRWEHTLPKRGESLLLCAQIPARVCSGDDIQAHFDNKIRPCRVIDIWFDYTPPKLLVKVWLPEEEVPDEVSGNVQPLNPTEDSWSIGMIGVIHTNWLRWVIAKSVRDFAFVFHREHIRSGRYANAYGMRNSYFTRYQLFFAKHTIAYIN